MADLRPRHRAYLDGWRGVAILAVLVGHLFAIPGMKVARFGVELFFVLSGRLMADILFVEKQPLGYFFKRRIARVWPALYVFVFIMAVTFAAPGRYHVGWGEILGALTFTFNYVRISAGPELVLDHLWSLCVEEWGYFFLAAFALLCRRWDIRPAHIVLMVGALCALNGAIQSWMALEYHDVYWRTDVRLSSIFLSCGVFLLLREVDDIHGAVPLVAGVVGMLLNTHLFPDVVKYTAGTLSLAVAVGTIDRAPKWALSILSHRILTQAGLWSFSLYLWQQPFTKIITHWPRPLKLTLLVAAALASFYLVERPARRYLNQVWANRQRRVPAQIVQ